ncbi:recombinase family protein [Longispora sp. NPDC051575]|uniref:recombinase family protein n=1 Tax=Longispora sp. NPDC051575 TaxID=3154943 RepID=UPI0034159FD1
MTTHNPGTPSSDGVPVISYARISDDGEDDRHGVNDQHKVNRATAKRLGLRIVLELTDNDRSASKADVVREDFERMLPLLKSGKLPNGEPVMGTVVVADDRLARRAGDYERFVEALTAQEGRVYADERGRKDLYSEDVEGLGLVGVAFSKIESRKVRRRIKRWHRARAEGGKQPGGTRPFGWREDDRTKLEPSEAHLLATAARQAAVGRSLHSIIKEWQEQGVVTSLGNAWSSRTLKLALNNPRLCGWRRLGDAILRDDDGVAVIGEWEPVITPDEWLAVHGVIEARRGKMYSPIGNERDLPVDHQEHKHLLTGIIRCGKLRADGSVCGARLRITYSPSCVQHIYACPNKTAGGCAGVGRRGDMVDEFITEAVLAKLEEREAVTQDGNAWSGGTELDSLEAKLVTLRKQWTASTITDELFFPTARDLENQIRGLRADQARHAVTSVRARARFANVRADWYAGRLDISQKRAYVREALEAVIVLPAGKGRKPFNPDLLRPVWRV